MIFAAEGAPLDNVEIFWFFLGLLVGLSVWAWFHVRLQVRLRRLTRYFSPEPLELGLPLTANKLIRLVAAYAQNQGNLTAELERWKQLLQAAPIGFLYIDEDNQLLWSNPLACQLLGIENNHQARLLLELVRSYELDDLIEQTRSTQVTSQCEWDFHPVSDDPSRLFQQQSLALRAYGLPLTDGSVGVFLENRQEVSLLTQQRDRWISDVAHELKTPLTSIRLVAETLQLRLESPLRDWVDRLLNETIRLSSLVQDLLDLSHLEAMPTAALSRKTLDLVGLIDSAWGSLEPLAHRKALTLDYAGPDQVLLYADESRLHRVFLNLLDNSIKYSPVNQKIWVQVSLSPPERTAASQEIHIEVIDSGPGFPESALPYIFDRFYRVDPSRTRPSRGWSSTDGDARFATPSLVSEGPGSSQSSLPTSSGSGLGLAIVRQIVEAHQGIVQAGNHPIYHGAWVQIFLPWQPPEQS